MPYASQGVKGFDDDDDDYVLICEYDPAITTSGTTQTSTLRQSKGENYTIP